MLIHSAKELAIFVNNERKKLNLSQTTISNLVGLKQTTISAFENKPGGTKLDTLFQILSAVNLDLVVVPKSKTTPDGAKWNQEW